MADEAAARMARLEQEVAALRAQGQSAPGAAPPGYWGPAPPGYGAYPPPWYGRDAHQPDPSQQQQQAQQQQQQQRQQAQAQAQRIAALEAQLQRQSEELETARRRHRTLEEQLTVSQGREARLRRALSMVEFDDRRPQPTQPPPPPPRRPPTPPPVRVPAAQAPVRTGATPGSSRGSLPPAPRLGHAAPEERKRPREGATPQLRLQPPVPTDRSPEEAASAALFGRKYSAFPGATRTPAASTLGAAAALFTPQPAASEPHRSAAAARSGTTPYGQHPPTSAPGTPSHNTAGHGARHLGDLLPAAASGEVPPRPYPAHPGGPGSRSVSAASSGALSQQRQGVTVSPAPMDPLRGPDVERYFAFSSLAEDVRQRMAGAIGQLGQRAGVVECEPDGLLPASVTHVVVPDLPRSLKALCALVSGRVVCNPQYIDESLARGFWCHEQRSGCCMQCQPKPFAGRRVVVSPPEDAAPEVAGRLRAIIEFGAGLVVTTAADAAAEECLLIRSGEDIMERCRKFL